MGKEMITLYAHLTAMVYDHSHVCMMIMMSDSSHFGHDLKW